MKKILSIMLAAAMLLTTAGAVFAADDDVAGVGMTPAQAEAKGLVAFPGAEGGGKWTTGGRGGEVYHVTNLNDDGEGSLRDAVSKPNRIVVFDVSGTIHLKSRLSLKEPNITIAGQSAPGDGICVADYNISVEADNVIVRYMRFRPGGIADAEDDAISSRYHSNIIFDHCSSSWSTDETLSIYASANTTVQWCIASESLTLGSHAKGRHGYGGIWGGYNVSYHHNLVATHTSRTPRYGSLSSTHPDYKGRDGNDMVNNVIYNWGFNNAYGGEEVSLNIVNNYYKPGAITLGNIKNQFFNPSKGGKIYMSGNVMEGNADVTANNALGFNPSSNDNPAVMVSEPMYDNLYPLDNVQSAEDAYKSVLADAGATLPKRDSYDAKVINDVKNGTGRFVNKESEVGGWPELNTFGVKADTDGDGMSDDYEDANGFNKNDPQDGRAYDGSGYTNVEIYLNSLVENAAEPQNPDVSLDIEQNAIYKEGEDIKATAAWSVTDGRELSKIEFFVNDKIVGTVESAPYTCTIKGLTDGQYYLSARAVDSAGEATTSEVKVVNVNAVGDIAPWKSMDIGETEIKGSASLVDGVYTVKSAGLIGPGNEWSEKPENIDSFHYMYDEIDENGEISAEIVDVAKLTNNCVSGLMIRDDLGESADFALIDYEYKKMGAGLVFAVRKDGKYSREEIILDKLPRYIKLRKEGRKINGYHSTNGVDWVAFGETELSLGGTNYAGIAADGCREDNQNPTYSYGRFKNLNLGNYGTYPCPTISMSVSERYVKPGDSVVVNISGDGFKTVEYYVDGVQQGGAREAADALDGEAIEGLGVGNHYITVIARSEQGVPASATIDIGVSDLEDGWSITNIGEGALTGSAKMEGDKITIYGAGFGVDDTTTVQTPYIYKQMSGDFKMTYKVPDQSAVMHDYQQVGVMLRNGLADGDQAYALYYQKYNGEYFKENNEKGKKFSLIGQQKYKQFPTWISVEKRGNTVKMAYSPDGINYTTVGVKETNLNDNYYFGFFGASHEELLVQPLVMEEISIEPIGSQYADVPSSHWAYDAINSLTLRGIISGDEYGFRPDDEVTVAEAIKMIAVATGWEIPLSENGEKWYIPYFKAYMENANIALDTYITSDAEYINSTRADMAKAIWQSFDIKDLESGELDYTPLDIDAVPEHYRDAVILLCKAGILTGDEDGRFRPNDTLTRSEAATVIYRAINR